MHRAMSAIECATTVLTIVLSMAASQTLVPPKCFVDEEVKPGLVCNAILHFHDKVVDQGQYCRGCQHCSGEHVSLTADNSFVWLHFEHPDLLVQFLACGELQKPDRRCNSGEVAAIFDSPHDAWRPQLRRHSCSCPVAMGNKVPLYQLRSWSLQNNQWVYEFVCPIEQCRVPDSLLPSAPALPATSTAGTAAATPDRQPAVAGSPTSTGRPTVCAEKRQSTSGGPVSVTFKCSCPQGYHCIIHDIVLKADGTAAGGKSGAGGGGASAGAGPAVASEEEAAGVAQRAQRRRGRQLDTAGVKVLPASSAALNQWDRRFRKVDRQPLMALL
uniref:Uncharacterized protein n=1 Tax=Macrostomum lignano TaxID=282301 RepID=A0A1I8IX76_9PLAT